MTSDRPLLPALVAVRDRLRVVEGDPPPPTSCPICRDSGLYTGYVEFADATRELWLNRPCPAAGCRAAPIARARQLETRLTAALGEAAIPPRFEDACIDEIRQPESILDVVRRACAEGESLLLWGPPGTGKTYLAVALLRSALAEGRTGRFVVVPDVLDRIRRSYGSDGPGADEVLDALELVDELVLDDLGTQSNTPWVLEKLYQILNTRYLHKRVTVITTNYSAPELAGQIGYRLVSRLSEAYRDVHFGGADRRITTDWQTRGAWGQAPESE